MYFSIERIERIVRELESYIYSKSINIDSFEIKECGYKYLEGDKTPENEWKKFDCNNETWGGVDKHYWFKTEIVIPKEFHQKPVSFRIRTGREDAWDSVNPQFLLYINNEIVQGMDINHREVLISESANAGDKYEIALYAHSGMEEDIIILKANIAVFEREIEKLLYNIKVPTEVAGLLEKDDKRRIDILNYMTKAINMLDLRRVFSKEFYSSISDANKFLEDEFYNDFCGEDDIKAICVGHTHIDVAWRWTLEQAREKAVRSFSTVLNLMKEYPDYVFVSSQPQLYKYVKEACPELYEEIKKKIKEGKWEAEGAMWLESDCNLTSGESLIRQILFGTKFFKQEFNVENKILWLPDVFGYSTALPQILKKSGIEYFMTTKLDWNEYNRIPYDTFMWKGLDGSEVLTHFVTTSEYSLRDKQTGTVVYGGQLKPSQVMGAWARYQQKEISNEVLIPYGFGDGGGGTTRWMLENEKRIQKGIPGCPVTKKGKAIDFFENIAKNVKGNKKLPKWVGELYLEYHRGTYTSMARNKRDNRKAEFLYQDIEFLYSMNKVLNTKTSYPQEEINKNWELILLNQFHDIIPGSSIKEVYEDSDRQYKEVFKEGKKLLKNAIKTISCNIKINETSAIVFNQLSQMRSDIVEFNLPEGWENAEIYYNGKLIASQVVECNKVIFYADNVPSKGYKVFEIKETASNKNEFQKVDKYINSRYFDIEFDENYNIKSIYDKGNDREVISKDQKANVIQAFEDKPLWFDAWDINIFYQEKMWEVNHVESVEILECGPIRNAFKISRKFLDSTIEQIIYTYSDIPRIDFKNKIDWKEQQILLKAAFPVDIHSEKASYEIQYGNVERPTHWNTSWDYARFEVCAHKWADLSEGGYGVSLLNDCKYGYDIKDNLMRLTLLKSGTYPNPDADKEVHEFTYSLYPHSGTWKEAKTTSMGYNLNCPMYVEVEKAHDGPLDNEVSIAKINKDNVIIEVIKKAEDSDDLIIRVYEYENKRTKATINFTTSINEVWECDMLENKEQKIENTYDGFTFEIKPYEIKTFSINIL